MKIDEVSKGSGSQSATSELTLTYRDPHVYDDDDIEAIDSQLREFANALGVLNRKQRQEVVDRLIKRGNTRGVDTLRATPSQIQSLAQIMDSV